MGQNTCETLKLIQRIDMITLDKIKKKTVHTKLQKYF